MHCIYTSYLSFISIVLYIWVPKIYILCVLVETSYLCRSGHNSVPTNDACVLKEAKDTQGINSGGSFNDNMASDFSTPESYAIIDGSNVISNTVIDGVLESSLRVTISIYCV